MSQRLITRTGRWIRDGLRWAASQAPDLAPAIRHRRFLAPRRVEERGGAS
jgi:hypothetical protein